MHPNSFTNRHVTSVLNRFYTFTIFDGSIKFKEFQNYLTFRYKFNSSIHNFIFFMLCLQIISLGFQPWTRIFWERDQNTLVAIKWLGFTSLEKIMSIEVDGFNVECIILLILIAIDFIIYTISYLFFLKHQRIPYPLMVTLKYFELGFSTFLMPMCLATFGTLINQPKKMFISFIYPILIILTIIKCNINLLYVQSSVSPSARFYYTTTPKVPRFYIMAISIFSLFSNLNSEYVFFSQEFLSISNIALFSFLNIWELVYFNWNKIIESKIILTLVSSSLVVSVIIEAGLHFDKIMPHHALISFTISVVFFAILYTYVIKSIISKTLKRLTMPNYVDLVKSGKQAAQDLNVGFSEVSPSVINMTLLEEVYQKFSDSPDVNVVLILMSLVLSDFPIPIHDLQNNLRSLNHTISTPLEIDEDEYKKDVDKLKKRLWKALGAMREFYKSILNEMVDFIPFNSFQCHDLIEKAAVSLLRFLESYPGREDGKFFFDLFRRIAPKHPSIKEMEYWCNYDSNYVEEILNIYPKLTALILNTPDTLHSYVPKQKSIIGKSVVEILDMEEKFNGRITPNIAEKGPFTKSVLNIAIIIIFASIFIYFVVITNFVLYPRVLQTQSTRELVKIYQFAEVTNKILTHLYPFELFYVGTENYDKFWNVNITFDRFREYLMIIINSAQERLMDFSFKPDNYVSDQINQVYKSNLDRVINSSLLEGDYTYYQAEFAFLYIASEIILNNSIILPDRQRHTLKSIVLLRNLEALIRPLYNSLMRGVKSIDLFKDKLIPVYIVIGIGILLIDAVIPISLYISFKAANEFNSSFFTSLRDTQKTALTDINNFLHSQMVNIWGKRIVWHPSTKTRHFPFWLVISPLIILILFFTINAGSSIQVCESYKTKIDNEISIYQQTAKQYSLMCYIVWGNFIYTLGGRAIYNKTFFKVIEGLHNELIYKSEQKMDMSSYARNNNIKMYNWLDNKVIQEWLSSSMIFLNIKSDNQKRIDLLRDYFIKTDRECYKLIRLMEEQWEKSLNSSKNRLIATFATFAIIPIIIIVYIYFAMWYLDSPFMYTASLLELINERALSNNTYHVLNNSGLLHEDKVLDHSFYDTILRMLPDAVFVINGDHSIISYNDIAKKLVKQDEDIIGTSLFDALSFKLIVKDTNIPINEVISTYTQEDCISVPTYDIKGTVSDVEHYFAMTILPLFRNERNGYLGATNRANIFAVTFRECTSETLQQNLIEEDTNKYMKIINQILPNEIAERLLTEQKAISMRVNDVCISFCDIVSFTPWCSAQSAESVVTALNTMFTLFDDCCKRYRSVNKIKTIGDCYMSAAGIFDKGDSPEEAAHQMLLFGLDMVDSIKEVNRILNINLRVRVGIAFGGPISAGLMGIRKPSFDVYGQVVNDGQTMESSGTPMMVHINKEMYDRVKDSHVSFQIKDDGTALVTREV